MPSIAFPLLAAPSDSVYFFSRPLACFVAVATKHGNAITLFKEVLATLRC